MLMVTSRKELTFEANSSRRVLFCLPIENTVNWSYSSGKIHDTHIPFSLISLGHFSGTVEQDGVLETRKKEALTLEVWLGAECQGTTPDALKPRLRLPR